MGRAKVVKKLDQKQPEIFRKKEKPAQNQDAPREYSQNELYEEGEIIYHKVWDDTGEVLEVGTTEDGIRKMKVHFEKHGVKTLRMGNLG